MWSWVWLQCENLFLFSVHIPIGISEVLILKNQYFCSIRITDSISLLLLNRHFCIMIRVLIFTLCTFIQPQKGAFWRDKETHHLLSLISPLRVLRRVAQRKHPVAALTGAWTQTAHWGAPQSTPTIGRGLLKSEWNGGCFCAKWNGFSTRRNVWQGIDWMVVVCDSCDYNVTARWKESSFDLNFRLRGHLNLKKKMSTYKLFVLY